MIKYGFLNATPHFEAFEGSLNPEDREYVMKLRQQRNASLV